MGVSKVKDLKAKKEEKKEKVEKPLKKVKGKAEEIVRLADTDVDATKPMIQSLRSIKGISYQMAKAICHVCNFDPRMRLNQLTPQQLEKLEKVISDPANYGIPPWALNRRKDIESGKDLHLTGAQLDIATKFNIRKLIEQKTWRGMRHMLGLPTRGQRTRSHFRKGKTVGVLKKAARLLAQKMEEEKKK